MGDTAPAATVAAITEHQTRLRALLDQYDETSLATRPPNGEWSAVENVRHLILTAQFHIGPFVEGGLGLSPLGLPQGIHPDVNASTDVAAVLDEWERIYADLVDRLDVSDPARTVQVPRRGFRVLGDQLQRFLRHQKAHGRLAVRALSEVTGESVRLPRASRTSRPPASA